MMLNSILFLVLNFLLLYYVFFILDIYRGLGRLKLESGKEIPQESISVIIPFRNEEKNLLKSLKGIEKQNYPKDKFEVIYVNDSSTDNSLDILRNAEKSGNVKIISVPKEFSANAHKKRAVRFGIQNSSGEIIVTTDADCFHGENWLRSMMNYMDEETGFISGPVEFEDNNNYFSKLQKLEFAGLVITGAGLIGSGKPTICNAANIVYRKKVFEEVKGFEYQLNLSSGDDELLMQKISQDTNYKIKFCIVKDAIVKTPANKSISDFYQQRKRWASKGLFYNNKFLILKLILIFLFYLSLPVQLLLGIFYSPLYLLWLISSFIIKALTEYTTVKKGVGILFDSDVLRPFLIAEILHIPYIIIAGSAGIFGNFTWKERKVKR